MGYLATKAAQYHPLQKVKKTKEVAQPKKWKETAKLKKITIV